MIQILYLITGLAAIISVITLAVSYSLLNHSDRTASQRAVIDKTLDNALVTFAISIIVFLFIVFLDKV